MRRKWQLVALVVLCVASARASFADPSIMSLSPTSGAVGESVVISGVGFGSTQGANTVTFNGAAATPSSWSDASIAALVPTGATTGNVVVTTGGVASNAIAFSVYGGYTSGYQYRRTIVLSHAQVPNTDQTDFPVLISGVYSYLANVSNGGLVQNPSGFDIVLSADPEGASNLDHEIDSYDPVTGTVNFWVRIPTLSHTVDTVIYLFYGNPSVTISQENKAGVWRNGYVSVYHLSNGTTLSAADSLDANGGANQGATATPGMVDGGANFNGVTSYIALPAAAFGNYPVSGSTTSYSLSFEVSFKTASSGVILGQDDGAMPGGSPGGYVPAIYVDTAGDVRASMFWHGAAQQIVSSVAYSDNQWHSLIDTYSNGEETLYVDGSASGTQSVSEVSYASAYSYFLGADETSGWLAAAGGWSYLNGALDEVRISNVSRSSDWIATEYANESSPSGFYAVEAQATPNSAPTIQSLSPTSGAVGESVTIEGYGFQSLQGASTVTFNGVTATPTNWNDASIVVPVPVGATTGNIVVTAGGVASNAIAFSVYGGYTSGYQYRRTIVLSHAQVSNTDQTDFPVLISGVYSYLANVNNGGLVQSPNGYDIVFSADPEGATRLDHEIDSYDPVTGTVNFWVRIPTLSHTTDTVIYLLYGNPSIAASQEDKAGVWRNGYAGVWHFTNFADSLGLLDATSTGSVQLGPGRVGTAALFTGSGSSYLTFPNVMPLSTSSVMTQSMWVELNSVPTGGRQDAEMLPTVGTSQFAFTFQINGSSFAAGPGEAGIADQLAGGAPAVSAGTWHRLTMVLNDGSFSFYQDGALIGTQAYNGTINQASADNGANWLLGTVFYDGNSYYYLNGAVDDVNISTVVRSADWIATEYGNQLSPSTFYAVGGQATPNSPPKIESLSPAAGAIGATVTIEGYGFEPTQGGNTVTFNGVSATPTSWNDASIVVLVPVAAMSGNVTVTVGGVASNGANFTLLPSANITNLSPTSGGVGTLVTITGTNFGSTQSTSTLTFAGATATPTTWSATTITVPVPSGATTGNVIAVVGGGPSNLVGFEVLPTLRITSLSPSSGMAGTYVMITGTLFGATQGTSSVALNTTSAAVTNWSNTSITAVVPTGASSGLFSVTVNGQVASGPSFTVTALPSGWLDTDVGTVSQVGSATFSGGTFTVAGGGLGIGGTADSMQFLYQPLVGDGSITARLSSLLANPYGGFSQAGVMIRETLGAGATDVSAFYGYNTATWMQDRPTTGAAVVNVNNGTYGFAPPEWLELVRSGNAFTAYVSPDGFNWTQIGSTTVTMAQTVYVGLAVSGNNYLTTATFDNVSVNSSTNPAPVISGLSPTTASIGSQVVITGNNFGATQAESVVLLNGSPVTTNSWSNSGIEFTVPPGATSGPVIASVGASMNDSNPATLEVTAQPLPTTWMNQDVGVVGTLTGGATFSGGTFTVAGGGLGIGGTADSMQFLYQPLVGDGSITVRLSSLLANPYGGFSQAGVMIRETLSAGATDVSAFYGYNTATWMQDRPTTGAAAVNVNNGTYGFAPPEWLELVRSGNAFTAYVSPDGFNWTQIGSTTVTMAQTVYVGLAVSGDDYVTTAIFDNVSVNSSASPAPVISGLSATTASVGSQVEIIGNNFGAAQGESVVLLNGASITVNLWSNTSIVVTVPVGATSGLLVVSVAPSMNDSNPVTFSVTSQPLPEPWLDQDVGVVGTLIGSASYSSGIFTVAGGGYGIGGTADSMHFVYQTLAGDGSIIARITSLPAAPYPNASQGGVMIRETPSAGATEVSAFYGYNGATWLQDRPTTGASAANVNNGTYGFAPPEWLELVRSGNTFTGFVSSDGTSWTQLGSITVTMAQTTYIGLAVSGSDSVAAAPFDNVSVTVGTTPFVSSVSPIVGTLGASVTITGSNFGATQGTSIVSFNGASAASVTSWSSSQIIAVVPGSAPNGTGPVTVTANSVSSPVTAGSLFTIINPVITALEPPSGPVGGTLFINGSGFGASQNGAVFINGVSAPIAGTCLQNPWYTCWNDTQIQVIVPNTTTGMITVSNDGIVSNLVPFTVTNPPVITSLSPSTGEPTTVITIGGSSFGATQSNSTAAVGGINAAVSSWSDGQIVASVPDIAMNGPVTVTVAGITAQGPLFIFNTMNQLTASNGAVTTYDAGDYGNGWRLYSSAGPGCSTCSVRGNLLNSYDTNGNLLSTTDANSNAITYTYDGNNNMASQTAQLDGLPVTTSYTYNNFAEVLSMTDALGNTTTNSYDAKGNLLTVVSPAPNGQTPPSVTQFTYNTLGELTQILDPLNHPTAISYYSTGLIQSITDAQNHVTTYAYDSRGNRTSVIDPINGSAHPTTFGYDAMNRLTGIAYPDGTSASFQYDSRGRRTLATDQNSKTTTYAYDDADRLISVTDAATNLTQYGYDTEGNLTSITDGDNHTTYFAYDTLGRVTQTTFPSTLVETYGYDQLYNLTSKTDRKNQTIQYVYDSLYRMTSKTYPDETSANYVYDLVGKIQQVTDPTGTYGFAYDNMGRLTGTTTQYTFLPGHNFQNSYGYDAASNRTVLTAPDGSTNSYNYDTLNRLTALTNSLTGQFGFGYDALSRRTQLTRPNGISTNYSYDSVSHLLSVLHQAGSTTLDGASYGYDYAGNRTSKTNYLNGITSNYGYDAIYELQQVTQGGSTTESYSYDAVGNRMSSSGVPTYSYNPSNELTSNSSGSYTYDANGNTLSDPSGKSYTWDFENRLTQAVNPGVGTTTFKYDPFGRRIQKSGPLGTTNYLYDGKDMSSNVIEEVDNAGNVLARYTQNRGIDQPLAEARSSATSYYEADALGSVTSLSGSTGAVANTYTYDSFGKVTNFAGTLTNPFQYTGHGSDPETNLDYYRFRYYDPSTGRFLSEDPITFSGGIDFYSYVRNRPLDHVDPFGLCCKKSPPPPPPNRNPIPNGISKDYEAYWKCVNNVTVECKMPEPPSGNPFEPPGGPGGDMGATPNEGTIPLPQWKIPDACECLREHPLAPLDPRYGDVPEPGNCF
jgi:RHS repeat-associated protein